MIISEKEEKKKRKKKGDGRGSLQKRGGADPWVWVSGQIDQ
jgi:hypothetical protein